MLVLGRNLPLPLHPNLLWLITGLCPTLEGALTPHLLQLFLLFGVLVCSWGGYLFVCWFCFGLGFFIVISLVVVAWDVLIDLDLHRGTAL